MNWIGRGSCRGGEVGNNSIMSEQLAQSLLSSPNVDFVCPHCGIHSLHTIILGAANAPRLTPAQQTIKNPYVGDLPNPEAIYNIVLNHVISKCVRCQKETYFLVRQATQLPSQPVAKAGTTTPRWKVMHQYPIPMPITHRAVNSDVRSAAVEAQRCLSVGANNACGVMLRRAIHCLCQDKGASGKDLFEQLADLKATSTITPDLWEWSEELRVLGKHGAHPEWPEVTPEDAEYGMKFLEDIVRYVYINPYELAQRRVKETSTKTP